MQSALCWLYERHIVCSMLQGLPGWSYYYKILNLFEPLRVGLHCTMLCFTSCRHGAFDLNSLKLSHCETAWWPKGACVTSRHHALFCFIILKDPVKKVVRSISAKTLQKHAEFSVLFSNFWSLCFCFLLCARVYTLLPSRCISKTMNIHVTLEYKSQCWGIPILMKIVWTFHKKDFRQLWFPL